MYCSAMCIDYLFLIDSNFKMVVFDAVNDSRLTMVQNTGRMCKFCVATPVRTLRVRHLHLRLFLDFKLCVQELFLRLRHGPHFDYVFDREMRHVSRVKLHLQKLRML